MSKAFVLEQYNPGLSDDAKEAVLQKNFSTLQQALSPSGSNLLSSKQVNDAGTAGSAWTVYGPLSIGFNSSGGVVLALANLSLSITNGGTALGSISLWLDNALVAQQDFHGSSSIQPVNVSLFWAGKPAAGSSSIPGTPLSGNHTFQIKTKTAAGTLNINPIGFSSLTLLEFL